MREIYAKIIEYDNIVIHRHYGPDLDALGSQFGLAKSIKSTFPNKQVHVVGDVTQKYAFIGDMDEIEDSIYKNALVIVLDSGSTKMISDERYSSGDFLIKIDHHINREPYGDICCVKEEYSSTCEIITEFIKIFGLDMNNDIASTLYYGMVTDSGRFLYNSISQRTFELASYLFSFNLDVDTIYPNIYSQDEAVVRLKGYFMQNFTRDGHVSYLKHTLMEQEGFEFDFFTMSRGMVNVMSGIEGIDIWCNFTEKAQGEIICELRSSCHPIVDVATKYGGGGHMLACGCTVDSWEKVDMVIEDLKKY